MPERVRPFGIAATVAAAWAVGMGLVVVVVPVLVVWALAPHSQASAGGALVLAADIWLGANHVGFFVGGARFALLPMGLLVLPFVLLRLSGAWAARILRPATLADAGLLVAATSLVYGLLGGLVAAVVGRPAVHADPLEAVLWCGLVAVVAVGWTVTRTCELQPAVLARVPATLRAATVPAAAGLLAVLGGAALITLASLLAHGGDALDLARSLDGGAVGDVALLVLSVLYLPNLVVWAAAFCVGPGFAVGTGTGVTLAGVSSGPLPAFPLFAALPSSGVPAAATWLCLLVPLAGGAAVAVVTHRRRPGLTAGTAALCSGLAGVGAGLALGALAWLSGGPLGGGRLATVGPSAWQVAVLAAVELGLVGVVVGWLVAWRAARA